MERISHHHHIIRDAISGVSAMLLAGAAFTSCVYDYEEEERLPAEARSIRVNTRSLDNDRRSINVNNDKTFMLLFWLDGAHQHLDPARFPESYAAPWPSSYHSSHTPQPVDFYEFSVYDTRHPYPDEAGKLIYATGYAPGEGLTPAPTNPSDYINKEGITYKQLYSVISPQEKGRYDFLACDYWPEVYKGSLTDPFSQEKNKLYFRHLGAKLLFYADRDKATMENKQFVRYVKITNLQMKVGDAEWESMHTPHVLRWEKLGDDDFTAAYNKAIESAWEDNNMTAENGTRPVAGYKVVKSETFAGAGNPDFVLQRNASDRVPVSGMAIDSCYVCNPTGLDDQDNRVVATGPIQIKMDISAELSFDPNFALSDADGYTSDDLTFNRSWKNQTVETIYAMATGTDGKPVETTTAVTEFKPGREYRVYIRFYRTGVKLVAQELPWDVGGVHYVTIPGEERPKTP